MSNRVNVSQALDLKLNHDMSYSQIGKLQGVSNVAVFKKLKPLLPTKETEVFQTNKADILDHAQLKLLSQVNEGKLKKVSVRDAVVSFGILYDKARLERGQSTSNVDIHALTRQVSDLDAEIAKLESKKNV